jgi:hypothetical protein
VTGVDDESTDVINTTIEEFYVDGEIVHEPTVVDATTTDPALD